MKSMFAAYRVVYAYENSYVKIIGIFKTKKTAKKAANDDEIKFLKNEIWDGDSKFDANKERQRLDCRNDCYYDWIVCSVKVEI